MNLRGGETKGVIGCRCRFCVGAVDYCYAAGQDFKGIPL